jgi:hypothetical protein
MNGSTASLIRRVLFQLKHELGPPMKTKYNLSNPRKVFLAVQLLVPLQTEHARKASTESLLKQMT